MVRGAAVLLLVLAVGCGTEAIGEVTKDLYQSGTRIKARMLVTADGAKSFVGWRDTQLGVDCVFAKASDGKMRCLPFGNWTTSSIAYGDSGCTSPVAMFGGCSDPTWVGVVDATSCSSGKVAIYEVSGEFTGSLFDKSSDGSCSYLPSLGRYWALRPETPPSTYAEAAEQLE